MEIDIYKNIKTIEYIKTNNSEEKKIDLISWKKSIKYFQNKIFTNINNIYGDLNNNFLSEAVTDNFFEIYDKIKVLDDFQDYDYKYKAKISYMNRLIINDKAKMDKYIEKQFHLFLKTGEFVTCFNLDEIQCQNKLNQILKIDYLNQYAHSIQPYIALSKNTTNLFVEMLLKTLQYEYIQIRRSKMYKYFDMEILNENINLYATPCCFEFDDEGTKNESLYFIKNGRLKQYLTNLFISYKFNQPTSGYVVHNKNNYQYNCSCFTLESNAVGISNIKSFNYFDICRVLSFNIRNGDFKILVLQSYLYKEETIIQRYLPHIFAGNIFEILKKPIFAKDGELIINIE